MIDQVKPEVGGLNFLSPHLWSVCFWVVLV